MYDVFPRLIYERKKMRLKPKYQVLLTLLLLLLLKKKYLMLVIYPKNQIMIQKFKDIRNGKNILLLLIIISSRVIHLMQR